MSELEFPALRDPGWFDRFEAAPLDPRAYGNLDELLGEAEREGVLDLPAESAEPALSGEANQVRTAVVAERLWLLGYLRNAEDGDDPHDRERWARYLDAVRRFQEDAGLEPDRWVGDKTWRALQELVTFETPTRVHAYAVDAAPRKALVRALRLRLFALGLLPNRPTPAARHEALPQAAMKRFWLLVRRLGMVPFDAPHPARLDWIEWIFDQNRLVEGAGRSSGRDPNARGRLAFRYLKRKEEKRQEVRPEVCAFLVCLAKIELWLLGLDVDIDGKADYQVHGVEKKRRSRRSDQLEDALDEFWRRIRGRGRRQRKPFVETITPELFIDLAAPPLSRSPAPRPIDDFSQEACEVIRDTEQIASAWSEGRSLGMRLWDGLERVWRWLSRGVRRILEIGKNLLRGFYRYALEAYEIVRFSTRTIEQSLWQYARGRLQTGDLPGIEVGLTVDADFSVTIRREAEYGAEVQVAHGVRYFGYAFQLSCRILALIADVVRNAATGAVGWARLIWDLVKGYRSIRPVWRQLRSLPRPAWV